MLPILVIGAIAVFALSKSDKTKSKTKSKSYNNLPLNLTDTPTPTPTPSPTSAPTYKRLAKDLMDSHEMNTTSWVSNIKLHPSLDGLSIGSDENNVVLTDNKSIKLVLNSGGKKSDLETTDTNSAVRQMIKMARSDTYTKQEQKNLETLINLLLKYKNSYVFNKYLKHYNT
jgi:hypothetical protein